MQDGIMKHTSLAVGIILLLKTGTAVGQNETRRFELESKSVRTTYTIEVVVPQGNLPPGTKYPVVYCMEWFMLGDYLKSLPRLMELGRLTGRFILIGITQGRSMDDWAIARTRDYTPERPSDDYSI